MPDIGVSKDALRAVIPLTGEFVGTTDTQTVANKNVNATNNTITDTSIAVGDILHCAGSSKFTRLAMGAANKPLVVNSGATDVSYATLPVAGGGTGAATLTGIVKASGTSAMTAVAAPTGAIVGDTDTQSLSGKTFLDQGFKLRNPAATQTLTFRNPVITSSLDYRFNDTYAYSIFKDGSTYYAKSGITKAIEFSGSTADVVIQSAITATLALSRGGIIRFSADDFPIVTPLDIPTATTSNAKPLTLQGTKAENRLHGTMFSASASFPTNRYMIETSGATDTSLKFAALNIRDIGCYNTNFSTINAGFLKYESDSNVPRQITIENLYTQYMWRPIHLIGVVWWGVFNNLHFEDQNTAFVGDADITMEQGSHTNASINPWPKSNSFKNILAVHTGTTAAGGSMKCSLNAVDSGYNLFDHYWVDSNCQFIDSIFSFTGKAESNIMRDCTVLDTNQTPSPDNRFGCLYLSGTNCRDNRFVNMRLTDYSHSIAIKSGAYRNDIEAAGYWGANLDIDDTGAGVDNVVRIVPGQLASATAFSKPSTTAGLVKIIDNRKGARTYGVSTQSGNASTTAFNIAHGCFTTPSTYWARPLSADAQGSPVITITSTNIVVTYPTAPPSGTSNLSWSWEADVY